MRTSLALLKVLLKIVRHSISRHKRLLIPAIFLKETKNGNGEKVVWLNCHKCKTTMAITYKE